MRTLIRLLGVLALLALGVLVIGAGWAAWRIHSYEQRDDPKALARKRAYLERVAEASKAAPSDRPNIVVILFDDLGLGDLGPYGGRLATPRIDRLARQGVALDRYYAPAPYCTPSRAGLLTGRYPIRAGLTQVVFPRGSTADRLQRLAGVNTRLPADEITLAEVLRAGGYRTQMVGKWHLGDAWPSLPRDLGFDHYLGVLYSNDMEPLALYRDREVVEPAPVDQRLLTARYTEEATAFVEANAAAPFFLYLAHTFPHRPLHASQERAGSTQQGVYGDVVADLDASVGAVLDALDRAGVARRTWVVVTSDNGPWFLGSAGGVRGRKNETFEGGMRVPFVTRLPGRIPAGVRRDGLAIGLDVFPTALALAGLPLPQDRVIDGRDLLPLLARGAPTSHDLICYYADRQLQAVGDQRWKWHARHGVYGGAPFSWLVTFLIPNGPWLFDLERDADESYDVSAVHPDVAARLAARAAAWQRAIDENPRGWIEPAGEAR